MSLTKLMAHAAFDKDSCIKNIMEQAKDCDFETRPLAQKLDVSYPTLIRVLKRLGIHGDMRERWLARRVEKKQKGLT